ncbi:MAG: glycosyltransferase family 39 protein [Candidatus Acidiferrales bacterium]|jgi:4-amino-4-deoxy-L-arabinose transferase-like glycosyltransferase
MRVNAGLAVLAGLALRVFFVLKFPVTDSGDAPFYIELAWNWLKKGVYGFPVNGQLTPVDMRVPGYPAFIAAVFAFAGNSPRAVMLAQAVLDLATCFLIALIASRLAPEAARRRVALAGLWLAALCPFTANYTAVVLTETLTIFLTTLAILILLETELGRKISNFRDGSFARGLLNPWFLAGIVVGFGTLVRPETPLLLFAAGLVLAIKWWRPVNWLRLLRAGLLLTVGVVLPLIPWAARNWRTLHDVQFLAPRYSELPGEYTPLGFNEWTNTWMWHFRDVYLTQWKLNVEEISLDDIPATAFDSAAERGRVSDLLDQYNEELTVGPALDQQFREVARERTLRHPLRTYLKIPFLRALTLWFTPRLELLPYSGHLRPVRVEWEDDRPDFLVTLALVVVNIIYLGMALVGGWMARRHPGVALLVVFIIIRTAFFTTFVETPEPRYVLECFPAVIALAAQVFAGRTSAGATASS